MFTTRRRVRSFLVLTTVVATLCIATFSSAKEIDREASAESRSAFLRAQELYDNAYNEDAEFFVDKSLTWNPKNADAICLKGILQFEKGDFEKAIEYYDKGITIRPAAPFYNNRGNALIELERLDDAISSLQNALQLNPKFDLAHCNLGICYLETEKPKKAMYHFNRAMKISPDFTYAECYQAVCHAELGDHKKAIKQLENVLQKNPDDEMATFFIEQVREDAGMPVAVAVTEWNKM